MIMFNSWAEYLYTNMGNTQSPEIQLRFIDRDTNSLRASLRGSNRNVSKETKDSMAQKLAKNAEEVSSLKSKVKQKHYEKSLKNISDAMHEVLEITPRESGLDHAAVESDSFVQVPIRNREVASNSSSSTKKSNIISDKRLSPTLKSIQTKLEKLKSEITTAINNGDQKQLRIHQETIKVLATDLEMLDLDSTLENSKKATQSQLSKYYAKIQKTVRDLKRDDNIHYLKKHNQKEKNVTELEDIEKGLVENESLLDLAIKNNELEKIATIKKNIVTYNQRLNAVDVVDTNTKERKIQLIQKVTSIVKEIENYLRKNNFDYNMSQAQARYDELKRTSENGTYEDDLLKALENLYGFVLQLEEYNETTEKVKQQLLHNIEQLLSKLTTEVKKLNDQQIVQDIVEENVVLRKKNRRSNEVTQIDQFYSYWNNVQNNFDPNSYSDPTLSRIKDILEDMKASINTIEKKIVNRRSQSNLLTQSSQSVPKLNKVTKQTYGSTKSLDTDGVIKTKVKYYNITSPEVQMVNVNDQLRHNYDLERNRFSKIEEIKTQVYYIREKLDQIYDKPSLKDKLQSYLNQVQAFRTDQNKTIASNAQIVMNDILQLQNKLDTELTNGQKVTDNFAEVLFEVQKSLEQLYGDVVSFKGTKSSSNYESLKLTLFELKDKLNNAEVPTRHSKMAEQKDVLIKRITYYLNTLESKVTSQLYSDNEIIKEKKNKLSRLKGKVERFNGTYKGVLYNQIEMDLNKLLLDAESIEDDAVAKEISTEAEKYLKILKQRASVAQSFQSQNIRASRTTEEVALDKIKTDLLNIKKEIDKTPDNQVNAFIGLKSRLDLVNLELDQINAKSCDSLEKEKEVFVNEAQTFLNVVNAKIALGQRPIPQWPLTSTTDSLSEPKLDSIKQLTDITTQFNSLRDEVNRFFGSHSDQRYSYLDNHINELKNKTDQFKFIKGTDLYMQKVALLTEMNNFHKVLETKAEEAEFIEKADSYIHNFERSIENKSVDVNKLQEQVLSIQQTLQSAHLSENMTPKKNNCLKKLSEILEKIKQHKEANSKEETDRKLLEEIEEKLLKIKPEIESFVGVQSDSKFYELDETVMRLIIKLDKMEFTKGSVLHAKKLALLKELHTCEATLDQRANDAEVIADLEKQISQTSSEIDNYHGSNEQYKSIESHMESIRKNLEHSLISNDLVTQKNACKERFSVLFNKFLTLSNPQVQTRTITKGKGFVTHQYSFEVVNRNSKEEITNINSRIEDIKKQLLEFMGDENSEEYTKIDDELTKLTLQLNSMKPEPDSSLERQKITLKRYIEECTDMLDQRASEVSSLAAIEKKLNSIILKIQNDQLSDVDLDQLDEQLITIQVKIGKLEVNIDLKNRKDQCASMAMMYLKIVADMKKRRADAKISVTAF